MGLSHTLFARHQDSGDRFKQVAIWTVVIIPAACFWLFIVPFWCNYTTDYDYWKIINSCMFFVMVFSGCYWFVWVRMNYHAREREIIREQTIIREAHIGEHGPRETAESVSFTDSWNPDTRELQSVRHIDDLNPAQWLRKVAQHRYASVRELDADLARIPKRNPAWKPVRMAMLDKRKPLRAQEKRARIDGQYPDTKHLELVETYPEPSPSPTVNLNV